MWSTRCDKARDGCYVTVNQEKHTLVIFTGSHEEEKKKQKIFRGSEETNKNPNRCSIVVPEGIFFLFFGDIRRRKKSEGKRRCSLKVDASLQAQKKTRFVAKNIPTHRSRLKLECLMS